MEKKTKKILFIITKANFGGAQRYVHDLAVGLPREMFDRVVAHGEGAELPRRLSVADIRAIKIDGLGRDISFGHDIRAFLNLARLYRSERPDVVHLNSSKIGVMGAIAGRLLRVPKIVFTGHGWAFNEERGAFSKLIIWTLYALTILLSHHTIAVSKATKKQMSDKFPFLDKKMTVIYNGVDRPDMLRKEIAREMIMKIVGNDFINNDASWVGSVGELHHIKGHRYLIDAVSELYEDGRLGNAQFFIVGAGEERVRLQKQIIGYGLSRVVFLTGNIPDICRYMKAFDIFVFPSLSEAFPYTILEAGIAGLPIISCCVGGIKEIIKDEKNGLCINPRDVHAIKMALLGLIKDNKKAAEYGRNLGERVETDFSKKSMLLNTINIYNS